MTAPTPLGTPTARVFWNGGTSGAVAVPASFNAGELLVMFCWATWTSSGVLGAPTVSGWTVQGGTDTGSNVAAGANVRVLTRFAQAGDTSWTVAWGSFNSHLTCFATIVRTNGYAFDTMVAGAQASVGSLTLSSLTTAVNNEGLIGFNNGASAPTGMTDYATATGFEIADASQATAGTSISPVFSSVNVAAMIALQPAPPPIAIAAQTFTAGHSALPAPTPLWKAPTPAMVAGHSALPAPTPFIKVPAASLTAGHSAAPAPALRWIVNAPAMTAGHPSIPAPLVGEFLRISAVPMVAGHSAMPAPTPKLAVPATMAAGHSSMPAPVVSWKLAAVQMRAGVPLLAPPAFTWRLPVVTMRAGVPVLSPPVIIANFRILAATMTAGVPSMPAPRLQGNNGPATNSQVVTDALAGRYGPVVITWTFERRTIANQYLSDASPGILGCTIDLDNSRASVRTATFTIDPTLTTVDAIADHLAVIANLLVHYPGNPSFPLPIECGLYALNVPDIQYATGAEIVWTVAATDLSIHLVQSTTTDVYTVAAATNYVSAINSILSPFGFQPASITPTASTLTVAQTWPAGTPWLTIINKLLADLNYYPLFFDRMGVPTSRIMIDNSTRVPDVAYSDSAWLVADIKETTDTTRFANQIVARVNNPGVAPLSSVATNADPASPTSTVTLGRTITQQLQGVTAPDQATLNAIAQQALRLAAGAYRTATINTQLDPRREPHEVYALTDTVAQYGGSAWLVDTWKLDVDKPDMQHKATAVIPVLIS